jgi:hypothetical protein
MTALELSQSIGKIASILFDSIRVNVRILDGKTAYGTPRYLITPVSGTGSQWVNADRVSINPNIPENQPHAS